MSKIIEDIEEPSFFCH